MSEAHLHDLVSTRVPEGIGGGDAEVKEYLKDLSSFANTHGGDLVIGIEEEEGDADSPNPGFGEKTPGSNSGLPDRRIGNAERRGHAKRREGRDVHARLCIGRAKRTAAVAIANRIIGSTAQAGGPITPSFGQTGH